MKAIIQMISLIFYSLLTTALPIQSFWPGQTLSKTQVEKRWGKTTFDKLKFRKGTEVERAKMAAALLEIKKDFVGLDATEIRKQLGDYDGHYFRDSIPTYLIHLAKGDKDSSWQIVFLVDNDFRVADIIVHKNCCD